MSNKKVNSRKFTAFIPNMRSVGLQEQLLILLSAFLFMVLVVLVGAVYLSHTVLSRSYAARASQIEHYEHWKSQAERYRSPDVLYNAAVSAIAVKKYQTAIGFLNEALELDPAFEKAHVLKKELRGAR